MLAVSTESLAVLAAMLATGDHAAWLLYAAWPPFVAGLAAYVAVMARFDLRQVAVGRGDHWIIGGALGILALAGAQIMLAARSLDQMVGLVSALKTASTALWVMAIAWLPILLAAEVLRPRLDYDVRRWSTVFPFGMYAACSFAVGVAAHSRPITDFAKIWVWVSVVVWLVVSAATLGRLRKA
jgi:tellurite resistance protein TehA-like permease